MEYLKVLSLISFQQGPWGNLNKASHIASQYLAIITNFPISKTSPPVRFSKVGKAVNQIPGVYQTFLGALNSQTGVLSNPLSSPAGRR